MIVIIRNEQDWADYVLMNSGKPKCYAKYQMVPEYPPSYPCAVHSMILNMGEYEFVGHTFITVEDIEMPEDVNYEELAEAQELMQVAESMYDYYGETARSELRNSRRELVDE